MNFINKLGDWLEKHVMPLASVIGGQKHLAALRDGFIATLAVNMIGAMATLLNNVLFNSTSLVGKYLNKIGGYSDSVQPALEKYVTPVMGRIWWGTLAVVTIFLVVSISYNLAKSYEVDGVGAAISAIASYFCILAEAKDLTGALVPEVLDAAGKATEATIGTWGQIAIGDFGSTAMFTGIIVALLATEIFVKVTKAGWVIKMPEQVPPAVSRAFSAIFPAGLSILAFSILGIVFTNFIGTPFKEFIEQMIQNPLVKLGQSPFTYVFMVLLAQILWFFGIHGSNMTDPAMNTMYKPPLLDNIEAVKNGLVPQNVLTRNFLDVYAMHGGSGATLGLVIAIYLFSKKQEYRELAKLATAPGLFNINEPVIFGLPLVLNPLMFIPFVFTPAICVTIAYIFTAIIPFADKIAADAGWTAPPVLGAFIATNGDWKAAVLALCTLLLSIVIYAPFIVAANRMDSEDEVAAESMK